MSQNLIEDMLREEYLDLLPEIRSVVSTLEAEIRYHTRHIRSELKDHEQLIIKSRTKECDSAIETLRGKSHGRVFDPTKKYSMRDLPDLVGVRVLVFPNSRVEQVDSVLRPHFQGWRYDPVPDGFGLKLAHKYDGYLAKGSPNLRAEYQIVPMLLGLFWEVEHAAMYKSEIVANSGNMRKRRAIVETALSDFEAGVASLLPDNSTRETSALDSDS